MQNLNKIKIPVVKDEKTIGRLFIQKGLELNIGKVRHVECSKITCISTQGKVLEFEAGNVNHVYANFYELTLSELHQVDFN